MSSSARHLLLRLLLVAVLALSATFATQTVSAAEADAKPLCTNQLHTDKFCVRPAVKKVRCAEGYTDDGQSCVAVNPYPDTDLAAHIWECPEVPEGTPLVVSGRAGSSIGLIGQCNYLPSKTAGMFSSTRTDLWG